MEIWVVTETIPGQGAPRVTVCGDLATARGVMAKIIRAFFGDPFFLAERDKALRKANEIARMGGGCIVMGERAELSLSRDRVHWDGPNDQSSHDKALAIVTKHLGGASAESLMEALVERRLMVVEF